MRIRLTEEEVGKITLGLGWNTWSWRGKPLDDKAWGQLLELFVASRCQWVRLDVRQADWEPRDSRKAGYAFDTPRMKSLYRWLDACEKHDIHVLWANYFTSDPELYASDPESAWMSRCVQESLAGTGAYPKEWPQKDEPADHAHFVESFADVLKHLVVEKGYQCVRQVSLFNEATSDYTFAAHNPWPFYRLLDAALRARGLRDRIQILGPDDHNVPRWFWREFLDFPIDIVAFHDYWNFFNPDRVDAARGLEDYHTCSQVIRGSLGDYAQVAAVLRALSSKHGTTAHLAITEYGHMGNTYKVLPTGGAREVFGGALSLKCFLCEILKLGCGGALRWSRWPGAWGHSFAPVSVEGVRFNSGGLDMAEALRQGAPMVKVPCVYEPERLANTVIRRGDAVIRGQADDAPPGVHWVVLKDPTGRLKAFLVNLRSEAVILEWEGRGETWKHLSYQGDEHSDLVETPLRAENGAVNVTLAARSVNGLI